MAVTEKVPVTERGIQVRPTMPVVSKRSVWPKALRWSAVGLAGVGVGASLVLGVVNARDVDSLQTDMRSAQSGLASTQGQLHGVQADLIKIRSGFSLEREHLAQQPGPGYGLLNEHLAQAPSAP